MTIAYTAATLIWLPSLLKHRADFKGYFKALVLLGLLSGFSHFSFAIAMVYGSVVRVMMLFYLAPLWAVLIGYVFLREPLTNSKSIAVICSIVGAYAILGGSGIFATPPSWVDFLAIA